MNLHRRAMASTLFRRLAPTRSMPPLGGGALRLPDRPGAKWRALKDLRLAAGDEFAALDLVILHPAYGVALVVIGREFSLPDLAIRVVRSALRQGGFSARFPGFLPVVFLDIAESDLPGLPSALVTAFAREAAIELDDPNWPDAALIAITRCGEDEPAVVWAPPEEAAP